MRDKLPSETSALRLLNDFFFLLNLVLFYSLAEIQRLSYLGSFESKLKGMLNTFLHLDLHNELGGLLAFFPLCCLALECFSCFCDLFPLPTYWQGFLTTAPAS